MELSQALAAVLLGRNYFEPVISVHKLLTRTCITPEELNNCHLETSVKCSTHVWECPKLVAL